MGAKSTTTGEPVRAVSSIDDKEARGLESGDTKLVDLVTAVLVDPNLHTDLRMRLSREITELLRDTHGTAYGAAVQEVGGAGTREVHGDATPEPSLIDDDPHLARLLQAMLVDPDLHTDMRMRLYDQIPKLVHAAQSHAAPRAERLD